MIPLVYFLMAWLVFIAVFGFMSLLTVFMNLRYGLSGLTTYVTTALFIGVTCLVLLGAGGYLLSVDWTTAIHALPETSSVLDL